MTKTQLHNKRQSLVLWAFKNGFTEDRFGNFTKIDEKGKKWRFSISKSSVRLEFQLKTLPYGADGKPEYRWIRWTSGYLRDVSVDDKGTIIGMTRNGCVAQGSGAAANPPAA